VKTTYRRASHVLHRNAGPDVLAMVPGDEQVHVMTGPAAVLWDLLSEGTALDDLIREIADLYARSADEIAPSLEGCIQDLADRGLVEQGRA
jgi:hypothetical protein